MNRHIFHLPGLVALIFAVTTGGVQAHAFRSGSDAYAQFLEGTSVILFYPESLLPLVAAGILVGLWHKDGMGWSWPAFAVGLLIGLPLSVLVGPWVKILLMVLGVLTGALAALLPRHNKPEALAIAFATGLFVMLVSLEGHGLFELPLFIYVGILFMANLAFIIPANVTRMSLERFTFDALPIIFRVAASWIATILILLLAFEMRG